VAGCAHQQEACGVVLAFRRFTYPSHASAMNRSYKSLDFSHVGGVAILVGIVRVLMVSCVGCQWIGSP
jgi:hypothetical protein